MIAFASRRSAEAPAAMLDDISLRPAVENDRLFLYRVYASSREEELEITGWSDEQKAAFLEMQFNAQFRYYHDQFPDSGYQVIQSGEVPIGRIFVARDDDAIRLVDVGLLPEYCNQGVGTRLTLAILDESARTGKPVILHVEPFNPAMRLYQRLGFIPRSESGVYVEMIWSPPQRDGTRHEPPALAD